MKECPRCKAKILTSRMTCPLCSAVLKQSEQTTSLKQSKYPPFKESDAQKRNFVLRLLLFLSIVIGGTTFFINMLLIETGLWSLIVISGIIYLWLLIKYTIMTDYNISLRLMFQALTVTVLCFAIERSIPSISPNGKHWAMEYVMPFVMVATTLAITMLIFIRPLKYKDYSFYLFCMTIIGFLPLVLYYLGWMDPVGFLPSIISAGYSFFTILGMFMFADRTTKDELVKRFHI